jgi:tRNA threonylcarbamoyladenosine biosynthesis protein TsaE
MKQEQFISHSPEETRKVAHMLAARLKAGDVVALHGELGSGKTCLVQGLAEALGVERAVNSPTFTLISEYTGNGLRLYHIDLYRIRDALEAAALGLDEYL